MMIIKHFILGSAALRVIERLKRNKGIFIFVDTTYILNLLKICILHEVQFINRVCFSINVWWELLLLSRCCLGLFVLNF